MERLKIEASLREGIGKEKAKKVRFAGEVPGIIYGKDTNIPVKVAAPALKALRTTNFSESTIIDMTIVGGKKEEQAHVLVKDVQYNPVTDQVMHLDFMKVSLDQKIRVHVPVSCKGEAKGVKEGGILEQILWEVEVEGLPLDIPEKIEVDVSELIVGRSIHVGEVKVSDKVRLMTSIDKTVVTVVSHIEEAAEAAAGAEGAAPQEPEVIREKKEEAGAEGEAAAGDKKAAAKPAAGDKPAAGAKPAAAAKPAAKDKK